MIKRRCSYEFIGQKFKFRKKGGKMGILRKAALGSLVIGLGAAALSQNKQARLKLKKAVSGIKKTIKKTAKKRSF